jgi:hypothetical protein
MGIRDEARKILDNAVPVGKIYRSNEGPPNDGYFKCTNYSQATLMANWKTGGIMTGCNAFVGWYANTLGIRGVHS